MKRVSRKIVAMLSMLVLCLSVLFVPDMGNTKAAESISLSGKACTDICRSEWKGC